MPFPPAFRKFKWLKISAFILLFAWLIFSQSCMKFRTKDADAAEAFKKAGVSIEFKNLPVNGGTLHYAKTGSESLPTLFFVHGSPGSWDAFSGYMQDTALLSRFRMISVDRPGFGYSDFGKAKHLQPQAAMIRQIIEKEHNGRPVHLIGHSIGGPVIVEMAEDEPDSYNSLTILAGSISPFEEPRERWRYVARWIPFRYLIPGAFRPSNTEIVYFKKDLYHLDSMFHKIQIPVTFIHGDADTFVSVKNVDYGKKKLGDRVEVNVIIIPGANHFIPWQHYEIIQKHLLTLH